LFLNYNLFFKTAAKTVAEVGSTIIFIIFQIKFIASIISYSSTSNIPSQYSLIIGKVLSPNIVLTPSAIVKGGNEGWIFPDFSER